METFTFADQEILDEIEFDIAQLSEETQEQMYKLLRTLSSLYPNITTLGVAINKLVN